MFKIKLTRQVNLDNTATRKDIGGRAARAFVSVATASVLANGVGFLSTIILARILSPHDFGLMAMIATATALLSVFENFGLYFVSIQKTDMTLEEMNFLFWVNLFVATSMAAVLFFSAPMIGDFFNEPQLVDLSRVLALAFILRGASNQHGAYLNRRLEHSKTSTATVLGSLFGNAAAIATALAGIGVWALVIRQLADAFVRTLAIWLFSGWLPVWTRWTREYLRSVGAGTSITLSNLMYYMSRNADDILIGRYLGSALLGQYKLSYQILLVPMRQISDPIAQVMIPLLSQLKEDPDRYRKNYTRVVQVLHLVQAAVSVAVMFHAEAIIITMLGEEWRQAIRPLQYLAVSLLVQGATNPTGWLYITQGRTREMFTWSIFSSLTTVASFAAGLPFGITGVAAGYAIGSIIRTPIVFYLIGRKGPVSVRDFYHIILQNLMPLVVFAGVNCMVMIGYEIAVAPMWMRFVFTVLASASFLPILLAFKSGRDTMREALSYVQANMKKKRITAV